MAPSENKNISVLPPNLESARRIVTKAWFWLVILTTAPWFMWGYPIVKKIFHPEWNVLLNVALELGLIGTYTGCTLFLINLYLQRLCKKAGYVCPHCKTGLFQISSKRSSLAHITGRCPTCQQSVVQELDTGLSEALQAQEKKTQKKSRLLSLIGATLILVGVGSRYLITAHSPETHALEFLKNKQYDQAMVEIDKELEDNPKNVVALTIKGNIFLEMQKFDQALKNYDQALNLNPDNVDALNHRCLLHVAMEAYDVAINDCTHALKINPENGGAFFGRGMAYEIENQHDLAAKDLSEAIRLMPNQEILYTQRGMIYSNNGQLDEARKDFNKAQSLDPKANELLLGRGMLNVVQGLYGDAIADLEQVTRKTPVEPYALVWLHVAKLHTRQDDRQELEQKFADLSDNKWPSSVVALYLGRATVDAVHAQAATGYPAIREEQACEADYYIGEYYLQQHDRDHAKAALKSAIDSCHAMSNEKQAAIAEAKAQGF